MRYLLDSGILLRLTDETDLQHDLVCNAVDLLVNRREDLLITTQNIAEFWNVATRPKANNGLELSPVKVDHLFTRSIETLVGILPERELFHGELRRLLVHYNVVGKQVHDARLVAMMLSWQVTHILTLNERNFQRFEPEGITVVSPASLLATGP